MPPNNKPRRFVRLFKPRFAALVRLGQKHQTIRPTPKRMPRPGDILDARQWSGKPYRSKQVKIGEYVLRAIHDIQIDHTHLRVHTHPDGIWFLLMDRDEVARADGFKDWTEMLAWFEREHGLPFDGVLLMWNPAK